MLVDTAGHELGSAEKLATHSDHTPLHRAFSCYIFDDAGKFLATQRAENKKVWPGVWTNSCCGHPAPGESFEDAIRRRVMYELGMEISDIALLVSDYIYKTPPFRGIVEHEFCPIYIARSRGGQCVPNSEEVAAYEWRDWELYRADAISDTADVYSWWCKDQLRLIRQHPLVLQYAYGNTSI